LPQDPADAYMVNLPFQLPTIYEGGFHGLLRAIRGAQIQSFNDLQPHLHFESSPRKAIVKLAALTGNPYVMSHTRNLLHNYNM
jgi:hypothetical protein